MKSFPWNSIIDGIDPESGFPIYDRPYDAEDFRDVMQRFFTDGIFSDTPLGFGVTAGSGMTLNVEGGACMISGTNGIENESRTLMVQAADKTLPRIDTVVLRWNSDIDERNIDLYIVEGTPAKEPVRPELTRHKGTLWELGLCDVLITAGSTKIYNYNISDTRLDPTRCGIVTPFAEYNSMSLYKTLKTKIDEMVELTKSALDGTTAGHLQNQISDINDYTTGINLLRGTRDFTKGSILFEGKHEKAENVYVDGFSIVAQNIYDIYKDGEGFSVIKARTITPLPCSVVTGAKVGETYTLNFEALFDGDVSNNDVRVVRISEMNKSDYKEIAYKEYSPKMLSMYDDRGWTNCTCQYKVQSENCEYIVIKFYPNTPETKYFTELKKVCFYHGAINNPIWSASPFDVAQDNEVVHKSGDVMTGELNLEKPLSVKSGGTGDNTSNGARKNLGILSGVAEVTLRAGQGQNVSVMFTEKLNKTPVVVVMPMVNDAETPICELVSTSTSGFTMNCSAGTSGQAFILPFKFNWIAIETV